MSVISDLINNVRRLGIEFVFGRYYGIYPAVVTDNKDPKGMGRLQVKSSVFGHVDPVGNWVAPLFSDMMYDPPEKDSDVWIQFVSGNINSPVYVGTRKVPGDERFSEFQESNKEPHIRGLKTKYGHKIVFYDSSDNPKIEVTTKGGERVILSDKSGSEGVTIEDTKNGNKMVMDKTGVKVNGYYLVTEKYLDFMNKHIADFGLGNIGSPVPLNPAGTAPDFTVGYTTKKDFKTNI